MRIWARFLVDIVPEEELKQCKTTIQCIP